MLLKKKQVPKAVQKTEQPKPGKKNKPLKKEAAAKAKCRPAKAYPTKDKAALKKKATEKLKLIRGGAKGKLPTLKLSDTWYDAQDIHQIIHMHKNTLGNWRRAGIIPYYKIGNKIIYNKTDIQEILLRHRVDRKRK